MANRFDQIIIIIGFIVSFIAVYFLVNDQWLFHNQLNNSLNKPCGIVLSAKDNPKRRIGDDLVWQPLKTKDTVFCGDTLFTTDQATLELQLSHGKIFLQPNSLIVIREHDGSEEIEVESGSLKTTLERDAKLNLLNNKKVITVKGSKENEMNEISIGSETSGNLGFKVITGEAELKSIAQKSTLKANEESNIDETGDFFQDDLKEIYLLTPFKDEPISTAQQTELLFSWDKIKKIDKFYLVIASDVDLKNIVYKKTIEKKYEHSVPLSTFKPGQTYYWTLNTVLLQSRTSSFKVINQALPKILSPNAGLVSRVNSQNPLHFSWSDDNLIREFKLQIANNRDFSSPIFDSLVIGNQYDLYQLPDGEYFFRLHREKEQTVHWTPVQSFTLKTLNH